MTNADELKIVHSTWNKVHVMEGIRRACENPYMKTYARELDAHDWGVYRGESTQLIDNTFYGYQFPIRQILGFDSFEGLPEEAEGVERFYLFNKGTFADVGSQLSSLRPNGRYVKCWFNEITPENIIQLQMNPVAFVHIDGDLYCSCIDALTVLFNASLVIPGTVIAFDEFKSTSTLLAGGESLAWKEICEKYKVEAVEFFRNVYFDQLECWQNCMEIKSIGEKVDYGLSYDS